MKKRIVSLAVSLSLALSLAIPVGAANVVGNINLVNPTHYVYAIKKALDIYRPNIPIVYNSGGYDRVEIIKSLENYVDIYLMDLKYLNPEKATAYSDCADYSKIATEAILEAVL